DIRQELIAEPLPARSAAHQPGDVHELERGRHDPRRLAYCGKRGQPSVRNRHPADIRLNCAEWIVRRLRRSGCGERIEQGGLTDIWQTDNAAVEAHSKT